MKFSTNYNVVPSANECSKVKSQSIPGQALTPRTIMVNFTHNIPLPPHVVYNDYDTEEALKNGDVNPRNVIGVDLDDVTRMKEEVREKNREYQKNHREAVKLAQKLDNKDE